MADEDLERLERELDEAIAVVFGPHDLMVTKWVMVGDVITADGERQLLAFTSPDLRMWDSIGMLSFALERERGQIHYDVAAANDEDE